jgi:homoserine O-acetyltransferase
MFRLHRLVLEDLGVKQVAICIGGSLGGMQVITLAVIINFMQVLIHVK